MFLGVLLDYVVIVGEREPWTSGRRISLMCERLDVARVVCDFPSPLSSMLG